MDNRKYGLYKRIMKHDQKAIDEIESLEEAKELIKMLTGNDGEIYQMEQELAHKFMSGDKEVIDNMIGKFTSNRTMDVKPDIDI